MKGFKRFRKFVLATTIQILTVVVIGLGIDILVSGSVYHPVTYLYQTMSWWRCRELDV